MGKLPLQLVEPAEHHLIAHEARECDRYGLAIDVVVEVKQIGLDGDLLAVVEGGSAANVNHSVVADAGNGGMACINAVVGQDK